MAIGNWQGAGTVGAPVNQQRSMWLPWVFAAVFAVSRYPGLLPPNFSVAYAFLFCAGCLIPGRLGWALPLAAILGTDLMLNLYYRIQGGWDVFSPGNLLMLGVNYAGFAGLFGLGRLLGPRSRWLTLVVGGMLGAILFYLVTNTAAWWFNPFRNPEYTRNLAGWLVALTKGTGGYPPTWEFFRNTLLSGGLFTALFAGTWKLTASESPADKGERNSEEPAADEAEPAAPASASAGERA